MNIKCNFCGKEFIPSKYKERQVKNGIPVYCSKSCATAFRYKDKLEITDELILRIKDMFYTTELPYDEIQKLSGLSKDRFGKLIKENNIKRNSEQINKLRQKHLVETMQSKYSVSNAMELQGYRDKIRKSHSKRTIEEKQATVNKIKQTKLEKYGDENYNNSEKTKLTNLENIGTTTPLKLNEVIEKRKQASLDKYGVDNPFKASEVQLKAKKVLKDIYGEKGVLGNTDIRTKIEKTNIERYGVSNAFRNTDIQQKQFNTIKDKYGVEYACQLEQCANTTPKAKSGPNIRYENLLKPDRTEFPIGKYRYDLLKGDTLIEIDPTHTHNVVKNPFGNPVDVNYHIDKTKLAILSGYQCIHIFDWDDYHKIKYLLQDKEILYARNLDIKEVSMVDTTQFLTTYHLQNSCRGQSIRLGLYKDDELIEIMTFGSPRYNKNFEWELLRLCTKAEYKVVGGAEKLFKYFINVYKPKNIISYCDFSKFSGEVYTRLGFKQRGNPKPSKHWSRNVEHITDNLLRQRGYDQLFNTNYGKGTSNEELMLENGWLPIYDCGQLTFSWENKEI